MTEAVEFAGRQCVLVGVNEVREGDVLVADDGSLHTVTKVQSSSEGPNWLWVDDELFGPVGQLYRLSV